MKAVCVIPMIAGALVGCVFARPAHAQQTPSTHLIERLPADVDLVISVDRLASLRATPTGRGLESFLAEASDWSRTTAAWRQFAAQLGMPLDESINTVLGSSMVVAARGEPERTLAVLSHVNPDSRRILTRRLEAVPRAVTRDATIMSLERGSLHLATRAWPREGEAESGDGSLMGICQDVGFLRSLLRPYGGDESGATLRTREEWGRISDLAGSEVFLYSRSVSPDDPSKANYFALGASSTNGGWTAQFRASDGLIPGIRESSQPMTWPSEAVDQLEEAATLLIAGSPQPRDSHARTLLDGLIQMMRLPPAMTAQLEGTAIIRLRLPDEDHPGTTLLAALPLRDLASGADLADAWAAAVVGIDPEAADSLITIRDGVRSASVAAGEHGLFSSPRQSGRSAWCYAAAGGVIQPNSPTPGWVVFAMHLEADEDPVTAVRRTASLLAREKGKDQATLFRLAVMPGRLAEWAVSRQSQFLDPKDRSPDLALPVRSDALRWLKRVETHVVRGPARSIEGSIGIELNLKLLDSLSAAPPGAEHQAAHGKRE